MKSQNKNKPRKIDLSDISSPENVRLIRKVRKILRQRVLEERMAQLMFESENKSRWKQLEGTFERITDGKLVQEQLHHVFCSVQARLQRLSW